MHSLLFVSLVQWSVSYKTCHTQVTTIGDKDKNLINSKVYTTAIHGTVQLFKPETGDLDTYEQRLTHYFIANGVQNTAKKRARLFSLRDSYLQTH